MNTDPTQPVPPNAPRSVVPGDPVPDDRIHGDDYGDAWLRPTLTADAPAQSGPPPSVPPERPSAKPYWLVAGLGATLVLASIAGLFSWGSLTGGIWRTADEHKDYAGVTALSFKGGASDVEVRGGGTPGTVQVERHLNWGPGSSRPEANESVSNGELLIGEGCEGAFLSWCSIDYVVTVPDATKVTIDSGSGDVDLTGAMGDVAVTVGSGDLEGTRLDSQTFRGQTGSGDVDVSFAGPPSDVVLKTGSGDVTLSLPTGQPYAVTGESGSGDRDVRIATDPTSQNTIAIETGSGDVEVSNP